MEVAVSSSSSSAASEALVKALISRGWCFRDVEQVKGLIALQYALHGDSCTVDLVESDLANMDLRTIGGKSLPDPSLLRNSSHLPGPKVLQISSVRDISRSSIDDSSENSHKRRLLRLKLTDGHSEITATEYSHIPSIANDVVPGTKVVLENKAPVYSSIVCLNPKVITVLGGIVQSLYEEWQMNQKYSGFSRSSLRISKESDADGGPPPFEKLQISALTHPASQGRSSQYAGSTSKSCKPTFHGKVQRSDSNQITKLHEQDPKADNVDRNRNSALNIEKIEESTSSSAGRPREVVESVPVQNQAAAQKLLQKMSQPNREGHHSRGRKYRGKGKQEDSPVFTLDEWERRKAGANSSMRDQLPNLSQDEDLARQLQDQFDLEDFHVQKGPHESEAERIRMSMFNFQRDDDRGHDGGVFKGRGRGRGRSRRGRGRG